MDRLASDGKKGLEQLIVTNIPKDVLMACEDAYRTADYQGRQHSAAFMAGHRASAAGQSKHFFTNETFYEALQAHGANPTPLCGTRLVVGRLGIFNIARLNVPGHKWVNLRRSTTRARLSELNSNIEKKFVQGDLFAKPKVVAEGTIFILGVMDGIDENGLRQLTQVMVALPAPDMKSWLYLNSMAEFLRLYEEHTSDSQRDNAMPKLKAQRKKQDGNDKGN